MPNSQLWGSLMKYWDIIGKNTFYCAAHVESVERTASVHFNAFLFLSILIFLVAKHVAIFLPSNSLRKMQSVYIDTSAQTHTSACSKSRTLGGKRGRVKSTGQQMQKAPPTVKQCSLAEGWHSLWVPVLYRQTLIQLQSHFHKTETKSSKKIEPLFILT